MFTKILFILLIFITFFYPRTYINADSANISGFGNTVKILNSDDIKMKDEIISLFVGATSTKIEVVYNFLNTSNKTINATLGFPEKHFGDGNHRLNNFTALQNQQNIKIKYKNEYESGTPDFAWYIYHLIFEPNENKKITNIYEIENSSGHRYKWVEYILETGASWKDRIDRIDIYVHFQEPISVYDLEKIKPSNFIINKDNETIEWHFRDIEPNKNDNLYILWFNYYDFYRNSCICDEKCLDYSYKFDEVFGNSSSYLKENIENYYPCKAFDNNTKTAWVEGSKGGGENEWINVPLYSVNELNCNTTTTSCSYEKNEKIIKKLKIFNGYGKSKKLWTENNRVKKILLSVDDYNDITLNIPDYYGYQILSLPKSIKTNKNIAKIKILDIYKGTKYDDTAISEIRLLSFHYKNVNQDDLFGDNDLKHKIFNAKLYKRLKGRILLKVEDFGKAYYIHPKKMAFYYLGRPNDAFRIMKEQGLGISETDYISFKKNVPVNLAGLILLRVQNKGEAYYVDPENLKMHYLGRPNDAFNIMRDLGMGVSNQDFNKL